jgi:hypothetical protein
MEVILTKFSPESTRQPNPHRNIENLENLDGVWTPLIRKTGLHLVTHLRSRGWQGSSIHREILREVDLIGPSRLDFHGQRLVDTHDSEAIGPLKVRKHLHIVSRLSSQSTTSLHSEEEYRTPIRCFDI